MRTLKRKWWLIGLLTLPVAFVVYVIDWVCAPSLELLSPGIVEGHLVFQPVRTETGVGYVRTPIALDLSSFDLQMLPEGTSLVDPHGEWILVGSPRHASPPTLLTAKGEREIELEETITNRFMQVFAGQCGAPWTIGWPVQVDHSVIHDAAGKFTTYDLKQDTQQMFDTPRLRFCQWCMTDQGDELYASVDGMIGHYEKGMPPRTIGKGWSPAWSPTGGLAFVTRNRKRIVVVSATDGKQRILNGPGTGLVTIAWAPDGEHLAFVCDFPGWQTYLTHWWRIGVINVHTGRMWQVLPNDGVGSEIQQHVERTRSLQWTSGIPDVPKGSSEEEERQPGT